MEKNVQLAYQTLDYIRDHPEEWDQRQYLCGSTACYAGRAALISLGLNSGFQFWNRPRKRDMHRSITEIARRALGWTEKEASHVFFNFTRDFDVLERSVKEVLNGDIR